MAFPKFRLSVLCLVGFMLIGCSGGAGGKRQTVYPVSGTVTMSGGPVANAAVIFSPKNKQPVATGRTDDSGHFVLTTYDAGDGAATGDYVVLISKESAAPSSGGPPAGGHDPQNFTSYTPPSHTSGRGGKAATQTSTSALPEKYGRVDGSDLKATVKEEKNEFNFELKL